MSGDAPDFCNVVDHLRSIPQSTIGSLIHKLEWCESCIIYSDVALEVHASVNGASQCVGADIG